MIQILGTLIRSIKKSGVDIGSTEAAYRAGEWLFATSECYLWLLSARQLTPEEQGAFQNLFDYFNEGFPQLET